MTSNPVAKNMIYLPHSGLAFPAFILESSQSRVLMAVELYQQRVGKIALDANGYYNLNPAEIMITEGITARPVFLIDVPSSEGETEQFEEPGSFTEVLLSTTMSLETAMGNMGQKKQGKFASSLRRASELQETIRIETRSPLDIVQETDETNLDDEDEEDDEEPEDDDDETDNSEEDYQEDDAPAAVGVAPDMIEEMRNRVTDIVGKIERASVMNLPPVLLTLDVIDGADSDEDDEESEESEDDNVMTIADACLFLKSKGASEADLNKFRENCKAEMRKFFDSIGYSG